MPPNVNPQAILVANEKIRPLADLVGQLYFRFKAAQAEHQAEDWLSLFPNDTELVEDGSATDGRTRVTNADLRTFMTHVGTLLTSMEASANAMRNNFLKIAVHPEPR
jgi:hypothetical protein